MLTENNFEDIGKRLYDTEADPPAEGWNKIHRELHPAGRHKGAFFKRHWWKGLFLLIPVVTYLAVTNIGSGPTEKTSNISSLNETPQMPDNESKTTPDSGTSTPASEKVDVPPASSKETADNGSATGQKRKTIKPTTKEAISDNRVANSKNRTRGIVQPESVKPDRSGSIRGSGKTSASNGQSATDGMVLNQNENTNSQNVREDDLNTKQSEESRINDEASSNRPVEVNHRAAEKESLENKNTGVNELGAQNNDSPTRPSAENDELKSENKKNEPVFTENSAAGPISEEGVKKEEAAQEEKEADASSKSKKENVYGVAPPYIAANSDSVSEEREEVNKPQSESEKSVTETTDEEKKSYKPWRLSAGIVPTYIYRPVRPVATDEVLITNFTNKKSNYPERIGIGFMLGGAKALNNNLSLDAALSFNRISEQIAYSYSTGAVDTLLAVQQPDGSVKVNPVYLINTTEMRSKITFGNIRLGATYYFWQRARSRFNVSVFGGVDFVVGSKVEEQRNGSWVQVGSGNIDKMNYNLGLSGGYNMNLSKGWELTINPMLTYYPLKNNQKQQLFSFDQRSYGLNIMISKWF